MGDAPRGRVVLERGVALAQEMGDRAAEGFANLIRGALEMDAGNPREGERHFDRALELASATGAHELELFALIWSGQALLESGRPGEAVERLQSGTERAEAAIFTLHAIEALAGAAAAALDLGQLDRALASANRAATLLSDSGAKALMQEQRVSSYLYRVFRAAGDLRAEAFWQRACEALDTRAQAITDPERRRLFLQRPINRVILEEQRRADKAS